MTGPLTKRQRQILYLMLKRDLPTLFFGGTRDFYWGSGLGGEVLIIHAYMEPEFFLKARGLIEVAPSNHPQTRYRLTDAGRERAARIKEMPR